MKILTCIVAYSFNEDLARCLECLLNQSITTDVYIVNNKQESNFISQLKSFLIEHYDVNDDSIDTNVHSCKLILHLSESKSVSVKIEQSLNNYGFAYGCNKGLKSTIDDDYDYCWLLNPDAYAEEYALEKSLEKMDGFSIVGSKVLASGNADGFQSFGYVTNSYRVSTKLPKAFKARFLSGAAMLIPSNLIKELGFMKENFFLYWEEVYYCYRAEMLGVKLKVAEESIVKHDFGGTVGDRSKLQFYYSTRNQFIFIRLLESNSFYSITVILYCFLLKLIKLLLKKESHLLRLLFKALNRSLEINLSEFECTDAASNYGKYVQDL